MYNQSVIVHKVASGDTLYKIAQTYRTTVDGIISANPYLDPYRLRVGDEIIIYPGQVGSSNGGFTANQVEFMNSIRLLLGRHALWTRMLLISISDNLRDADAIAGKLTSNVNDIASIFRQYYGEEIARNIATILMDHLMILQRLFISARLNDTGTFNETSKALYKNADDVAFYLSSINPYIVEKTTKDILHKYLDATKNEMSSRISNNYQADIKAYDDVENQIIILSDNITDGIINQFPHKFS